MPPVSDDKRIRQGLKFLHKADKALIRANLLLEILEEVSNPQGPAELLHKYTFDVGGKTYAGTMTQDQSDYLKGYTASQKKFADAIARVLLKMNRDTLKSMTDLEGALVVPGGKAKAKAPPGTILQAATGCCTYDDNQQSDGVTKAFCQVGLAGQWSPNPCDGIPPDARRRRAARSAR
jgi:hypothetical protein